MPQLPPPALPFFYSHTGFQLAGNALLILVVNTHSDSPNDKF